MSEGEFLTIAGAPDILTHEGWDGGRSYIYMPTPGDPFVTTVVISGGRIRGIERVQVLGTRLAPRVSIHPKGASMEDKRKDGVEGEGSYSGSKDYNERTKKFVQSGKVDQAARDAEPKSEEEKHQMQKAERIGKDRAKGEDPALKKK